MQNFTLTVEIPDELAARAQAAGLDLENYKDDIVELIELRIRRREAFQRLDAIAEKLQSLPDEVKPTPEDIQAEIAAYWAEQANPSDTPR